MRSRGSVRCFSGCAPASEAAALRHLFFAEREASKVPGLADVAPRSIKSVAVIGAGTMGVGIATCFVEAGYAVTLLEQDDAGAQRGLERMREIQDRAVATGRISADEAQHRLARVTPTANAQQLADADLVVEAVFEDMQVKIDLFRRLEPILRSDAILASNTSYLDLDQIAAATQATWRRRWPAFLQPGAHHEAAGDRSRSADQSGDAGNRARGCEEASQARRRRARRGRLHRQPHLRGVSAAVRVHAGRGRVSRGHRRGADAVRLRDGPVRRVGHVRPRHRLEDAPATGGHS